MAIRAPARPQTPGIGSVFMRACGPWAFEPHLHVNGRMLSLYETSDTLGVSCEPMFRHRSPGAEYREIALSEGQGHGTFFRPIDAWLQPVRAWPSKDTR